MAPFRKVVLITGASSGIGAACAQHLASVGYCVYGTSRRERQMSNVTMLQMDVHNVDSVERALATILATEGCLDVVVNNAGFGFGGSVEDTSDVEAQAMIETNFLGILRVCRVALPVMRKQRSGLIVNVSSIGGLMGLPYQGVYSATKFAIEGMTEALRMEVKPFDIDVVLLEPGDVRTEFTANRRDVAQSREITSPYQKTYQRVLSQIEKDEQQGISPERVAQKLAYIVASRSPRPRYMVGPFYEKLAVWVKRLIPARVFEWIIMTNYELGKSRD